MYAIVDISGKQFRAEQGLELKVPHQREEEGKKVSFDRVLLVDDGTDVKVGQPTVSGSAVEATVLDSRKSAGKVIVLRIHIVRNSH